MLLLHCPHFPAAFVIAAVLMVSGCSGKIRTENLDVSDYQKVGRTIDGVVVYPPALFKEISSKTALVNEKGILKGTADSGACAPVSYSKIVQMPDYSMPQRIYYEPGILETNSFGVGLENGQLTTVNSQSTPDRGQTAMNLAATLGTLVTAVPALRERRTGDELPACNEGTVIEGYQRYRP